MIDLTKYQGHTPGPWKAEYNNSDYSGGGQWIEIAGPDGDSLLWWPYNDLGTEQATCEANGALMVDAPLLLAQLAATQARVEALEADVERLDWLEGFTADSGYRIDEWYRKSATERFVQISDRDNTVMGEGPTLRAAINTARAALGAAGGACPKDGA
jgi:hypothetical protein